jgi:vitamin K-dependent gamma-carboxylase
VNLKLKVRQLYQPIHPGSLALFRILFGIIILIEGTLLEPYIVDSLTQSEFRMTYDFFHWIEIMTPENLSILFKVFYLASVMVVLGIFYRIAIVTVFLTWTYIFLLDIGHYNNHMYLFSLVAFILCFSNCNQWFSLRRWFTGDKKQIMVPKWQLSTLKFQVLILYVFAGIVKINWDWLNGYPVRIWGQNWTEHEWLNNILSSESSIYFISYFGILYDLFIVFILSAKNKKVKYIGVALSLLFHVTNFYLLNIGMFPFFGLAVLALYFNPSWPQDWLDRVKARLKSKQNSVSELAVKNVGYRGGRGILKPIFFILLISFVLYQSLYPIRPFINPGNASWNGAGHRFSWRMLLQDRDEAARFRIVIEEEGIDQYLELYDENYMNNRQFKRLIRTPKQVKRFAFHIQNMMQENGLKSELKIYAEIWKSLNNREIELLLDPNYNLLESPYSDFGQADYVLDFKDTPFKSLDSLYILTSSELNKLKSGIVN